MIIYLNPAPPRRGGTAREPRSAVIDRRYSNRDATIPEDRNGPAVLPLFCLTPHGVFRASRITSRAVSSYLAFSPLPALCCQRTGGVFSVTLSIAAILQVRRPRLLRGMLPYGVRTFLQQAKAAHQRSSAITRNLSQPRKKKREPRIMRM